MSKGLLISFLIVSIPLSSNNSHAQANRKTIEFLGGFAVEAAILWPALSDADKMSLGRYSAGVLGATGGVIFTGKYLLKHDGLITKAIIGGIVGGLVGTVMLIPTGVLEKREFTSIRLRNALDYRIDSSGITLLTLLYIGAILLPPYGATNGFNEPNDSNFTESRNGTMNQVDFRKYCNEWGPGKSNFSIKMEILRFNF